MRKRITINENEDIILNVAFEKFISLKKAMNLSKDTIEYYEGCYKYFTNFTTTEINCNEINEDTVLNYILYLRDNNPKIKDTTINAYLRGLRAILNFCMEKGYMNNFTIRLIRAEKQIKETYTDQELEKLLVKPNINECAFSEYRNWVMTCYLLGTGNRSRTVINLRIGDIDFFNQEIKLKTVKNNRQYVIPLSGTLSKTLAEYLEYRKGDTDDYLFCNTYGEQLKKDSLTTSIERYNKRRGVSKTSVHLYRHTFAKKWILNGGDIFRLQKILGHSSIEIVKEYVNMFGVDLQKNFENFNPLDNMEVMKKEKQVIKMKKL